MPAMSTPDRYLALSGSVRLSPVPDLETASSSGNSDDFSDMFDWDLYDANGSMTNVTTQSEGSAHARVAASPASPSDRSPIGADADGDIEMSDVRAEVPQPHAMFPWPGLSTSPPPRDKDLHIPLDSPPLAYRGLSRPSPPLSSHTEMSPVGRAPQRAPQAQSQKKSRVLGSPEKTSQVRELGACYHCKRNKSACSSGVCEWCTKNGPMPELACIRKPLNAIRGTWTARWNWEEFAKRQDLDLTRQETLLISFSSKPNSPCLPVLAAPFTSVDSTTGQYGLVLPAPSRADLVRWVQAHLSLENSEGFETCLDQFHIQHVQNGAKSPLAQGQNNLLSKVLDMKAMWRIWSCKELFVRRESNNSPVQSFAIQDRLRFIAGKEISELEDSILGGFEGYLKKEAGRPAMMLNVARWLSLVQMISVYRQSLKWMLQQEHTDTAPLALGVGDANERRRRFRTTTEELLRAVIVIYFDLFHKKSMVQGLMGAGMEAFVSTELHKSFQRLTSAIPAFYQEVITRALPEDKFFIGYVVERELQVLMPKGRSSRR
ncbi:hypothetical protein QBC38DRAFT_465361 [Podospora fimiseda]|uniref:Uncharacterized protein n=1 Tax=Podospora fimiseda TaxID=252190 RepID=A0AAN7H7Y9_9PEZI|nr:hypothetical protein QBC38DRAFT_465361 [Podospora fimiseda]